jgi:hypothetical protein
LLLNWLEPSRVHTCQIIACLLSQRGLSVPGYGEVERL